MPRCWTLALFATPGLLLTILAMAVCTCSHAEAAAFVKIQFADAWNIQAIDKQYFTARQFVFFRFWVVLLALGFWVAWVCGLPRAAAIGRFLTKVRRSAKSFSASGRAYFSSLAMPELGALLGLLSVAALKHGYYITQLPFTADEVFAFNYFVHPSPWVPVFYYPEPNNHVLFNLAAQLCLTIVGNPVWAMRLPSAVASLALLGLMFVYLHRRVHFRVAVLAVALCVASFSAGLYASVGRGYLLAAWWAAVALVAMLEWQRVCGRRHLWLFGAASASGFWTVPTFAYVFTGLALAGAWHAARHKPPRHLRQWLVAVGAALFAAAMLYSPVVAFSGIEALGGNRWLRHHPDSVFFGRLLPVAVLEMASYATGVWHRVYLLAVALCGWGVWVGRRRLSGGFFNALVWQAAAPLLLFVVLRNVAPLRAFTYLAFLYPLVLALLLHYTLPQTRQRTWFVAASVLLLTLTARQSQQAHERCLSEKNGIFNRAFYESLNRHCDRIVAARPRCVLANDHWFRFYLRFRQIKDWVALPCLHSGLPSAGAAYTVVVTSPDVPEGRLPDGFLSRHYRIQTVFSDSKVYKILQISKTPQNCRPCTWQNSCP